MVSTRLRKKAFSERSRFLFVGDRIKETTKKALFIVLVFVGIYAIVTLTSDDAYEQLKILPDHSVIGQGTPVLLELGASWCGPCRQTAPVLLELHRESHPFIVSAVDIDEHPQTARDYGVSAIPTIIFFDAEGQEVDRFVGVFTRDAILARWNDLGVVAREP